MTVRNPRLPRLTASKGTCLRLIARAAAKSVPSPPSTMIKSTCEGISFRVRHFSPRARLAPVSLSRHTSIERARNQSSSGPTVSPTSAFLGFEMMPTFLMAIGPGILFVFFPNRMQEIFAVAGRAGKRALVRLEATEAKLGELPGDPFNRLSVEFRVADNASGADFAAAKLELGLDEHQQIRAGGQEQRKRGKNQRRGDEGHIHRREVRALRDPLGLQVARIRLFKHGDARVAAQLPVELVRADVHCEDARGAALEQAIREPARRSANVECGLPLRVHAEEVQRLVKLQPRPAHKTLRGAEQPHACPSLDQRPAFIHLFLVHQHEARTNRPLRLLARIGQSLLDKQAVQTDLFWILAGHGKGEPSAAGRKTKALAKGLRSEDAWCR